MNTFCPASERARRRRRWRKTRCGCVTMCSVRLHIHTLYVCALAFLYFWCVWVCVAMYIAVRVGVLVYGQTQCRSACLFTHWNHDPWYNKCTYRLCSYADDVIINARLAMISNVCFRYNSTEQRQNGSNEMFALIYRNRIWNYSWNVCSVQYKQ